MSSSNAYMRTRRFGQTDLIVSAFGLGCARLGGIFKRDPADFVSILSAAFDAGITFFDTADIYSQGESEMLLGRAFRGHRRDQVVIASKAGYVLPSRRKLLARVKPFVRPVIRALGLKRSQLSGAVRGSVGQDYSPTYLRRAIEGSLRRLKTDRLDLFQLHSPPVEIVAAAEWVEALDALKAEGKIRYYGVSCDSVDAAQAALGIEGVSSLQLAINLLEREALTVLPRAHDQGVAVIARECLANGLLVKDVTALDLSKYTQSESEAAAKARQIELYREAAAERGLTTTQLALQFVAQLEGVSVSLLGVSNMDQLNSLVSKELPVASLAGSAVPYFE
jgi:aryl-alcohol dehydrogenase-like predicted oxidoreductase